MAVCLAGELFYLMFRAVNGYPIAWGDEGLWLAGGILGVLIPSTNLALLRRYWVEPCPQGTKSE